METPKRSRILDSEKAIRRMAEGLKQSSPEENRASPIVQEVVRWAPAGGRVLDIGAGVGRFTVPLAESGFYVEAFEPSEAMRVHLRQALADNQVQDRVVVRPLPWPETVPEPADVALAAYVVQFADDPIAFVRAMERAATRRVVLALHVDPLFGYLSEVWKQFRTDEPPPGMAGFSDLYPVLLAHGIVADVQVFTRTHGPRYQDPEAFCKMLAERLEVQDETRMETLRRVVHRRFGAWMSPAHTRAAVISWSPPED